MGYKIIPPVPGRTGTPTGIAPTVIQTEIVWDNADSTNTTIPSGGPSAWSGSIGDRLVIGISYRCSNNTDNLVGITEAQVSGTGICSGGFTTYIPGAGVNHAGSVSTMIAWFSAVVTTAGTFQCQSSGGTFGAGSTLRHVVMYLVRGTDISGSPLDGTPVGTNASTTPALSGTVTTTGAAITFALFQGDTSITITPASGWVQGANDGVAVVATLAATTGAATQASWALSSTITGFSSAIAFKSSTP